MIFRVGQVIKEIRTRQQSFSQLDDDQLRERALSLRYAVQCGRRPVSMVSHAFGLVVEASRRTIGLVHFDCQLIGGIEMAQSRIVEMKTGEGKTLAATLPVYLSALAAQGAHVATANDYLALRDAEMLRPVYNALGMSVDAIQTDDTPDERARKYRMDITYGTAKEFGFDFLRDRLALLRDTARDGYRRSSGKGLTMRGLHFALVDEADSILIDEARTPLIIGVLDQEDQQRAEDCFRWAAAHAPKFQEGVHYRYDYDRRAVKLKPTGLARIRNLPQTRAVKSINVHRLYKYVENAIVANRDFKLDRNYAVVDEEIVIIDEFTGRPAEGRQWQDGLHQAVEAREELDITPETKHGASITVQTLFRLYKNMTGMTGTAWSSRREFRKVYRKRVKRIPTNKPLRRTRLKTRVFPTSEQKWQAIAEEVSSTKQELRPTLVGTRSVSRSEELSEFLTQQAIEHDVLNAKHLKREAEIIEAAGQSGKVTVSTNMAGRGTDIKLDSQAREAGGLHVMLSEIHESKRIDLQLIGRSSRQGDPGSYRLFVSLDDEILLLGLGPKKAKSLRKKFQDQDEIPEGVFRFFRRAQKKLERKYLVDRMALMKRDKELREKMVAAGQDPFTSSVQ